jgi:hypothetical protein
MKTSLLGVLVCAAVILGACESDGPAIGREPGTAPNSATGTSPAAGNRVDRMFGPGTTSEVIVE